MSEWLPIETAPKDGTHVLVYGPNWMPAHVAVTWWCLSLLAGKKSELSRVPQVVDYWTSGKGFRLDFEPTHWMPLPAPP